MKTVAKNRLRVILRLIGLGLFISILTQIDVSAVLHTFRQSDLSRMLVVVVLFYPTIWLKSLRWRCLLPESGQSLSRKELFRSYIAGYFAGTVTPGRVGELSRVAYLRAHDVPVWESAFSVVADRALDIFALALLALMGTIVLIDGWVPWLLASSAAAGCLAGALAWQWGLERLPPILRRVIPWSWANRLHNTVDALVHGIRRSRVAAGPAVAFTVVSLGLLCIQILLMAEALNIQASPAQLIGAYCLAAIVGTLPITVAGVGTRDAALVVTFGLAGLPAESAVAFSSAILLLYILQGLLCMPFWLHVPGRKSITRLHAHVATEA